MEKRLVIISACRFTREALITLLPADRYVIRTFRQLSDDALHMMKHTCGYLLADVTSLGSEEQVRQIPVFHLYSEFPHICSRLPVAGFQARLAQWLLRLLPGDMSRVWLLTHREFDVLGILMLGKKLVDAARQEGRSCKTLHAIATRALMKLGLGTLHEFRLLFTGCAGHTVRQMMHTRAGYGRQYGPYLNTGYAGESRETGVIPALIPDRSATAGA
ncbi:TPA: LuxR family transcriptional regulator [Escherichia coli]|nr:LuxR family transcriptional regulator [Escherichia coli]